MHQWEGPHQITGAASGLGRYQVWHRGLGSVEQRQGGWKGPGGGGGGIGGGFHCSLSPVGPGSLTKSHFVLEIYLVQILWAGWNFTSRKGKSVPLLS